MNRTELKEQWLQEQSIAHIKGWDFSHIHGRYTEEDDLPWDYEKIVRSYLKPEHKLLDQDTGGGEFLLSLGHPYKNTSATEGYPPNAELCRKKLTPLGIDIREADIKDPQPFKDESFDIIINRHGDMNAPEVYRMLKPGGMFITDQVGAENDRELVDLLMPGMELPFPNQYLEKTSDIFKLQGFEIIDGQEVFRPIKFYDVGALVWFARIIEWEFPNFSVESGIERLYKAQEILERNGCIEGKIHRFLLIAKKPL